MNNHDELMSNFFAQPDALAYGKVQKHCFQLVFFPILASGALNFKDLVNSVGDFTLLQTPEELRKENVPDHLVPHKV